jgi:hypothetical protein
VPDFITTEGFQIPRVTRLCASCKISACAPASLVCAGAASSFFSHQHRVFFFAVTGLIFEPLDQSLNFLGSERINLVVSWLIYTKCLMKYERD